jgi:Tfp pilus assembly protein FimT
MKFLNQKAFTLIETLIVIAVVILLVVIVWPRFSEIRANQVLKSGVEDVVSSLNKARSQTLASLNSSTYGVHFTSNSVTIFTGDVYSAGAGDNQVINIVSPASISDISLTGGAVDIYFKRLTADPNVTGSITISNSSINKVISISATGIISVN